MQLGPNCNAISTKIETKTSCFGRRLLPLHNLIAYSSTYSFLLIAVLLQRSAEHHPHVVGVFEGREAARQYFRDLSKRHIISSLQCFLSWHEREHDHGFQFVDLLELYVFSHDAFVVTGCKPSFMLQSEFLHELGKNLIVVYLPGIVDFLGIDTYETPGAGWVYEWTLVVGRGNE